MSEIAADTAIVADDHEIFCSALGELLKKEFGFKQVLLASSLDEVIECLGQNPRISFACLDLSMPGVDGAASLHGIREIYPKTTIAVVTASERREDILAALGAGVHGFVPKSLGIQEVSRALRSILSGQIYVPAALAAASVRDLSEEHTVTLRDVSSVGYLSPRQSDVLRLMAQGLSNKEIARSLRLAEGTVKVHVNALYRALGAHNRVSAVAAMARLDSPRTP